MKLALALVSLALVKPADAQQANITEVANASIDSTPSHRTCIPPSNAVGGWYYQTWSKPAGSCSKFDSTREWSMLRAYRAGGQEGVHWKYTNDENDGACLTNWTYYTSDGQTSQGVIGRTTTMGGSRRWCALPVYRQGGVEGKQWAYCSCKEKPPQGPKP